MSFWPSKSNVAPRSGVASRKPDWRVWCAGGIWLGILVAGTFLMMAYANTPGKTGAAPNRFPDPTLLTPNATDATLVLFLHPHCPCSRATVEELSLLMTHCRTLVATHVFILNPKEMAAGWARTDLSAAAQRIPGVTVHFDDDGAEARKFGAETSGDTELFDPSGRLLFHGGITTARGHAGDNAGLDAIEAYILGQPVFLTRTPVYGCSLFDSSSDTP